MRFLESILDGMDKRRRRREREAALFFGGGCLVFIVLGVIVMIVSSIFNAVESAGVNSIYGDIYASACDPVPQGSDDLANLTTDDAPRRMLLLIGGTQRRHAWHSELPSQWQAENEEQVALVGCVSTERLELEVCEYPRVGQDGDPFTSRITRVQQEVTVVLLNAETSRRVDSLVLLGSEPEPCPEDDGEFGSETYRGDDVAWADAAVWIEGYVFDE